jgi:hypothetical protein
VNTYDPALNMAASGLLNLLDPGFGTEMDRADAGEAIAKR